MYSFISSCVYRIDIDNKNYASILSELFKIETRDISILQSVSYHPPAIIYSTIYGFFQYLSIFLKKDL